MRHYPFLNPHIGSQQAQQAQLANQPTTYQQNVTAQQYFNKIVQQVMQKKNRQKPNISIMDNENVTAKCEIHPIKPSKNCRNCKNLTEKKKVQVINVMPIQQKLEQRQKQVKKIENLFEINADSTIFHINEKLKTNILASPYFRSLYELKTFPQVVQQIKKQCNTIQTYQKGSSQIPTKFICLFYKFLLMRLTLRQVNSLLENSHVYVKIFGLLYVRMLAPYQKLWELLSPYLQNKQQFYSTIDKSQEISIGVYVQRLFLQLSHYQLRVPRIPIKLQKQYKQKLIQFKKKAQQTKNTQMPEPEDVQFKQNNINLLAVTVFQGKKQKLKVVQMGAQKIFVSHPINGQIIALDYDEVDLQQIVKKIQPVKQKPQLSNNNRKQNLKNRSRSRSHKKQSHKQQKNHKRNHKKSLDRNNHKYRDKNREKQRKKSHRHKKYRKKSSSSSSSSPPSSSSSSSSSSSQLSNKKNKTKNDTKHQKQKLLKTNQIKNQIIVTPPVPKVEKLNIKSTSLETLKANIKQMNSLINKQQESKLSLENIKQKYNQVVSKDEGMRFNDEQQQQIIRLG